MFDYIRSNNEFKYFTRDAVKEELHLFENTLGLLTSGPEVITLFSCSTQPSMKLQLLIKAKMLKNRDFSCFQNSPMLYLSCQ